MVGNTLYSDSKLRNIAVQTNHADADHGGYAEQADSDSESGVNRQIVFHIHKKGENCIPL